MSEASKYTLVAFVILSLVSSVVLFILAVSIRLMIPNKVKITQTNHSPYLGICDIGTSIILLLWILYGADNLADIPLRITIYGFFMLPLFGLFLLTTISVDLHLVFIQNKKYLIFRDYYVPICIFFASFLLVPILFGRAKITDNRNIQIVYLNPGGAMFLELFSKFIPYTICVIYNAFVFFEVMTRVVYKNKIKRMTRRMKRFFGVYTLIQKYNYLKRILIKKASKIKNAVKAITKYVSGSKNKKNSSKQKLQKKSRRKILYYNSECSSDNNDTDIKNENKKIRSFTDIRRNEYRNLSLNTISTVEEIKTTLISKLYKQNSKKIKTMVLRLSLIPIVPLVSQIWQRVDMFLNGAKIGYIDVNNENKNSLYYTMVYILFSMSGVLNLTLFLLNPTIVASLKLLFRRFRNIDLGKEEEESDMEFDFKFDMDENKDIESFILNRKSNISRKSDADFLSNYKIDSTTSESEDSINIEQKDNVNFQRNSLNIPSHHREPQKNNCKRKCQSQNPKEVKEKKKEERIEELELLRKSYCGYMNGFSSESDHYFYYSSEDSMCEDLVFENKKGDTNFQVDVSEYRGENEAPFDTESIGFEDTKLPPLSISLGWRKKRENKK
ncbi:hypothetical protein BB558_004903 [Smittium angustum]|uniref:Uncharacterized protein n=1 Tax=Smittium angustum TaxID=133377 RepID=A0A2U1J1Y7_SMIAN|nr:hypothetical protein BB558_004903 [Smittium angustum]